MQTVISFTARGNPASALAEKAAFAASHEKISHHPMFRCILRPRLSKRLWSKAGRVLIKPSGAPLSGSVGGRIVAND
jgi:hypothetical protein